MTAVWNYHQLTVDGSSELALCPLQRGEQVVLAGDDQRPRLDLRPLGVPRSAGVKPVSSLHGRGSCNRGSLDAANDPAPSGSGVCPVVGWRSASPSSKEQPAAAPSSTNVASTRVQRRTVPNRPLWLTAAAEFDRLSG